MFAKAPKWPSNGMRANLGPSDYNIMRLFDNTKQRRCQTIPWSRKATLGTGCQGIVWRGTFKRLPCAVKVMKAEKPSALEIRNFLEDGRVMASVAHPCIASCYMVTCRPYPAIILELLGPALRGRSMNNSGFTVAFCGAASALDHLHKNGIVHRDVKPAHLLRTNPNTYRVKLIDFDACASLQQEAAHGPGTSFYAPMPWTGWGRVQLDHYAFGATFMEQLGDQECEVSHDFARHLAAEPLQKLMQTVSLDIMEVLRSVTSPGPKFDRGGG